MSDPYAAKASKNATPEEKISEVKDIIKSSKFAMLTTRATDGVLHSRAMSPASDKGLVFDFIANNESGKFDELSHDPSVNVAWSDTSSSNWVSLAGRAKVIDDRAYIKEIWNPMTKAWFGDLGDGKHTGNYDDPRVSVIQVTPQEIRYWIKTSTAVGMAYEVTKGAITGSVAAPGALKVVTASELEAARGMAGRDVSA